MEYEFAPMEGITDVVYRRTHRRFFPGVTRYYTPFISPTQHHVLTPRDRRELSPEGNGGVPLVPQLLTKNAQDFLWAANELAAMGYTEVDLNLGCPSGTVTAKGKGAGFLARPDELDAFLEEIFASAPLAISIKTRLGMRSAEGFERLLSIYERYPVARLILHPRTAAEQYTGRAHREVFGRVLATATLPLSYNGDLRTAEDCIAFAAAYPGTRCMMLGRGLVADPSVVTELRGGGRDRETLRAFHAALCEEYPAVFGSRSAAAHRMKAIWAYMLGSFRGGEEYRRRIIKAKRWEDLMSVTDEIFDRCELSGEGSGRPERSVSA